MRFLVVTFLGVVLFQLVEVFGRVDPPTLLVCLCAAFLVPFTLAFIERSPAGSDAGLVGPVWTLRWHAVAASCATTLFTFSTVTLIPPALGCRNLADVLWIVICSCFLSISVPGIFSYILVPLASSPRKRLFLPEPIAGVQSTFELGPEPAHGPSGSTGAGGTCPFCLGSLTGDHRRCPTCATPHHVDCYTFSGGCSARSCPG